MNLNSRYKTVAAQPGEAGAGTAARVSHSEEGNTAGGLEAAAKSHTQVLHTRLSTYKLVLLAQGSLTTASAAQCGLQLGEEEQEEGFQAGNKGRTKGAKWNQPSLAFTEAKV